MWDGQFPDVVRILLVLEMYEEEHPHATVLDVLAGERLTHHSFHVGWLAS